MSYSSTASSFPDMHMLICLVIQLPIIINSVFLMTLRILSETLSIMKFAYMYFHIVMVNIMFIGLVKYSHHRLGCI